MKFHHIGIPTKSPKPGETYLEKFDTYCTDHTSNPFGIQWMRYGPGCPFPDIVREVTHVAFTVNSLEEALQGKKVIIPPNSPSPGVRVAFIEEQGAPVEFLEYADSIGS